jgi:hypothetical protein
MRHVHVTVFAVEKQAAFVSYSECVSVALIMQHARRMRRIPITLLFVASLALPHISTLSYKRQDF